MFFKCQKKLILETQHLLSENAHPFILLNDFSYLIFGQPLGNG